jgi:hypothetical protein
MRVESKLQFLRGEPAVLEEGKYCPQQPDNYENNGNYKRHIKQPEQSAATESPHHKEYQEDNANN